MADDWRVRVEVSEEGAVGRLAGVLREAALERDARQRLGGRVAVTRDGPTVFLYTGSEERAREAERVVGGLISAHDLRADVALDRWHPIEERWEDGALPLPQTDADARAEAARHEADEERETEIEGHAEWELRIELSTHAEARDLADRLEGAGIAVARRWRYLLVGVASEAEAHELATRVQAEAPPDAQIAVELSAREVFDSRPWSPFSLFGGMGG